MTRIWDINVGGEVRFESQDSEAYHTWTYLGYFPVERTEDQGQIPWRTPEAFLCTLREGYLSTGQSFRKSQTGWPQKEKEEGGE